MHGIAGGTMPCDPGVPPAEETMPPGGRYVSQGFAWAERRPSRAKLEPLRQRREHDERDRDDEVAGSPIESVPVVQFPRRVLRGDVDTRVAEPFRDWACEERAES